MSWPASCVVALILAGGCLCPSVASAEVDTDGDSLPDLWEDAGAPLLDSTSPDTDGDSTSDYWDDADGDGVVAGTEFNVGSLDWVVDSDGDGLTDGQEVNLIQTSPASSDTDQDGVLDIDEDPDGDGQSTGQELADWGTNPVSIDSDGDSLLDSYEFVGFPTLDPTNFDTDGNGTSDYWEDHDGDGLVAGTEQGAGCWDWATDSDGDTLSDPIEVNVLGTDRCPRTATETATRTPWTVAL